MSFSSLPMQSGMRMSTSFSTPRRMILLTVLGVFRADHTLVAQMQVVPQSRNDLMWKFGKNGTYYVRSTEYSGPERRTDGRPGRHSRDGL